MSDVELPRDPDLDELPRDIVEHEGKLYKSVIDPDTGAPVPLHEITKDEIAAALADARRRREGDEP